MLFILDKSLENIEADSEEHHQALMSLLSAYQNRHHLLFMEMKHLKILHGKIGDKIGINGKKILEALYNKVPSYKEFISTIGYHVVVYLDDAEEFQGVRSLGKTWRVPLSYFKYGLLQSTLLAENDRDTELYVIFSEFYKIRNKFNGFNVPVRRRSGGGSGIPRSLQSYIEGEYSPCLCLTDSDKLHPGFGDSFTSKSCRDISDGSRNIVKHIVLDERELENIIPVEILDKVSPDYNKLIDNLNDIKGYKLEMWKYLDIKSGCSLSWIQRKDAGTVAYWKTFVHHFERKRKLCVSCAGKVEEVGDNCTCSKIDGLGERVLEKTVEYLKDSNQRATLKLLEDDTRWTMLGQAVFEFLLAPVGERARV